MPTIAHFIDVGQGNMTLLQLADGTIMLYDCNVTDENEDRVLRYMAKVLPVRAIGIFVNSHRDADHMRGVQRVHRAFPIGTVWESGVTGGTPDSPEYRDFMDLRRRVGCVVVRAGTYWDFGRTRIRIMNAANDALPDDPNAQSIVMKVQQHHRESGNLVSSLMLAGDSDAESWRRFVCLRYTDADLGSSILLASHHGSLSFFDDPSDDRYYYEGHVQQIRPAMTVISVGPNAHGHPEPLAIKIYEKHTTGSNQGNKIYRTDQVGNIKLVLKDDAGWSMTGRQ